MDSSLGSNLHSDLRDPVDITQVTADAHVGIDERRAVGIQGDRRIATELDERLGDDALDAVLDAQANELAAAEPIDDELETRVAAWLARLNVDRLVHGLDKVGDRRTHEVIDARGNELGAAEAHGVVAHVALNVADADGLERRDDRL